MSFCIHCGNSLGDGEAISPEPQVQAQPQPQPPQKPAQAAPIQSAPADPQGQHCLSCGRVGDSTGDFCKYCGARYPRPDGTAKAPSAASPVPAAPAPEAAVPAAPVQPASVRPAATQKPKPTVPVASPVASSQYRLISVNKDGNDGESYPLSNTGQTDIGRSEGDILLKDDPYMSERHARVVQRGDIFALLDLSSENGVYLRIDSSQQLSHGDYLLAGQQVLRFEVLHETEHSLGPARINGVLAYGSPDVRRYGRLVQYTSEGVIRDIYYLHKDETVLGRENGDIVFTYDPFLSRRHAAIVYDEAAGTVTLRDLNSVNGTSLRIRGEARIKDGSQFRTGRHLFRFSGGSR